MAGRGHYQSLPPIVNQAWGEPLSWYRSWEWRQVLYIGKDKLPNRQQDWPNPPPVYWYKSIETQLRPDFLKAGKAPFVQTDWPNPPPVYWYRSLEVPLDFYRPLPFNQYNWPNPPPIYWYRSLEVPLGPYQLKQPFNQLSWPNPPPIYWYKSIEFSLPPGKELPPFRQLDWPLPNYGLEPAPRRGLEWNGAVWLSRFPIVFPPGQFTVPMTIYVGVDRRFRTSTRNNSIGTEFIFSVDDYTPTKTKFSGALKSVKFPEILRK